ncbi:DoxX family protein [Lentzea tibetensis]|uniref:DoxX family protein n=1 Tax=Lentzea tibetensis TaxID=2591470 RepID=A0A563EL90_9PSEU|nr:DoxX family membrane protein [Lentzea tibetensis]TWP47515.1 DoxX family protein [Lentzea tibetensis]
MSFPDLSRLHRVDEQAIRFAGRAGVPLLRLGLGVVYLWFGALKLIPSGSPVVDLVERTVSALTFGLITGTFAVVVAGVSEVLIALVLLSNRLPRITAILLLSHVVLVSAPLALFPAEMWNAPMQATLEAQYILKNVVTVAAAVVIAASASARATLVSLPVPRRERDDVRTPVAS